MNRSIKPRGPSGAKPVSLLALGGAAEAVPFPEPLMKQVLLFMIRAQLQFRRLLHLLSDRVFSAPSASRRWNLATLEQQARHVVVLRSVAHEGIQFLKQAA